MESRGSIGLKNTISRTETKKTRLRIGDTRYHTLFPELFAKCEDGWKKMKHTTTSKLSEIHPRSLLGRGQGEGAPTDFQRLLSERGTDSNCVCNTVKTQRGHNHNTVRTQSRHSKKPTKHNKHNETQQKESPPTFGAFSNCRSALGTGIRIRKERR
jgi:hypothetical protein